MHKDHLGRVIEQDCQTFTVYCLSERGSNIMRLETEVPIDGIPFLAEQMRFEAWDNAGGPTTAEIYARPEPYTGPANARLGRFIDRYDARDDAHPTPLMTTAPVDPTLPEPRKVVGPYD